MKKITAFTLAIGIALSLIVLPSQGFAQTNVKDGAIGLLSYLDIMSGDPDGNMRLDDAVSRAEFSKMAVAASTHKNSVATGLALSPFPDVTYKHWAAPYIRVAVSNGIVSGYPDGTFKPEDTVTYEEAVTMLLRVLGYSDDDFGNSWPSGQIGVADNIDLTDDVDCVVGDTVTRRDAAQLLYNALKTEMKDLSTALSYRVFDVNISEEQAIVATHSENSAIASDSVLTSNGTYKLDIELENRYIGMKGEIAVKNNKKLVGFVPDDDSTASEEYVVYSAIDNKVLAYKNGSITQIDINDSTLAYNGTTKTTFGMIKSGMELGDRLRVKRLSAGDIDYITYVEGNVLGPVTAVGDNWQTSWNVPSDVKVTRDGASVSASAIKSYDIVYYLPDMNMVMAYSDKITGVYETAEPNRDAVTSITVSGKSYKIESSSAFNKVHSGGDFEYGDTVMLLLGKDGQVADVINPTASTDEIVGYVTGTGSKEYASGNNTYKNYYVKLVQTDGGTYEYVTDRDYSDRLNQVVRVSFSDGYARVSAVTSSVSGGTFNWNSKKLGSDKVSASVNIIDIGTRNSSYSSMYTKTYGQRIDGISISSSKILYAKKNSSGEITDLILDDVTGDAYTYAVVVSASKKSSVSSDKIQSSYEYLVGGTRYSTTVSADFGVTRGSAVKIIGNAASPNSLVKINSDNGSPSAFTSESITVGGSTYKISDKVACYTKGAASSDEYSMVSLSELVNNKDNYTYTIYYDKATSSGGRVRVILATVKK